MSILTGFIIVLGIIFVIACIYFIYRAYKKRKKLNEQQVEYKKRTQINLTLLQSTYEDSLNAVNQLDVQQFYGSDEVLRKLKQKENLIGIELVDKLNSAKKHTDVVKIAEDIDLISDELVKSSGTLFENHNIENNIRNKLQTEIDDLKIRINNALPEARQCITIINTDNPKDIWRGFDYAHLDRNVETHFNKSDYSIKQSLNNLDRHLYEEAKTSATSAMNHMNNAFSCVHSIFDVNQQVNAGKEKYNQVFSRIPELINTVQVATSRSHVNNSTKVSVSGVESKYKELKSEINKGTLKDWILIGALIETIMNECNGIIRHSSRDIQQYEEAEAKKVRENFNRRIS
jgi:hypothetical protein